MHQSHRRHSRRLMNADTLDGERIGVLEYRTHCIICCWQRGCLSDQRSRFLYSGSSLLQSRLLSLYSLFM